MEMKVKGTILFLCIAFIFFGKSFVMAQQTSSQYPGWTKYRIENTGLGNSVVNSVAVDSAGNQWFGTNGGIAEYTGTVWKAYTMQDYGVSDKRITVVVAGPSGNIWAATPGFGLLKFDGNQWTVFNTTNSKLPDDHINDIKIQADTLWIGTNGGLVKMFRDSISVFTIPSVHYNMNFKEIDHIAFDGSGQIWVTSLGLIFYKEQENWTELNDGTNYYPFMVNSIIDAISYGGNNTMYISQGPLYSYDYSKPLAQRWNKIVLNTGNPDEVISGVGSMSYLNGILWVGNGSGKWGLASYDGTNWTFDEDTTQFISYVSSNFCMLGDSLIFGGQYQLKGLNNPIPGLIHFKNNGVNFYTAQTTGLGTDEVNGALVFDKNNRLWAGLWAERPLYSFLSMYDGQNWHNFDITSAHLKDSTNAITTDMTFDKTGNLWFGLTNGGVVEYDGQSFKEYDTSNSNLPSDYVQAIAVDQNNNVWVGARPDYHHNLHGGLAMFNGQTWAVYDTSNSGLTSNYVDAITVDENNHIWVGTQDHQYGTNDGGLVEYDGTNWTVQLSKDVRHSLPDYRVYALAVDKNNKVWLSSGYGYIYSYDGSTWTNTQPPILQGNNGYQENEIVNKLYVDSNNILWGNFSARSKLIAYKGSEWVQYYNTNSPIVGSLNYGLVEGPGGYIWVSSNNGIYTFKDDPTIFTAIQKDVPGSQRPQKVKLDQNYPNPFNPSTNISFELPNAMKVKLLIYNMLGRVVTQVSSGRLSAGRHEFVWQASNYASGVYFYRLITSNGTLTKKMILLK